MSGFSAEWLALRERYDLAARNPTVLDTVADAFLDHPSIAVVDLACGTGATLRAIGPHLPPRQSWRLVDNDLSLLARASALGRPPPQTMRAPSRLPASMYESTRSNCALLTIAPIVVDRSVGDPGLKAATL